MECRNVLEQFVTECDLHNLNSHNTSIKNQDIQDFVVNKTAPTL